MEPLDGQAGPLTDVGALARALAGAAPPVLLDVRWRLGGPLGIEAYRAGHLPRAVFVDLDADLAAEPGPAGRHPLPPAGRFQAAMRRAGVSTGSTVVVYDEADATAAARAWWLLRYFGHHDCQVLDGGYRAWTAAGGQVATGECAAPGSGDFTARPGHMPVLDANAAASLARRGHLLDARARERYRGEWEPIDPVAGHIPGAVSAPTTANVSTDGRFLPAAGLRARFASLGAAGAGMVGVYCGSGVTAAHEVLALELAGIRASLYVGSWSNWVADPARPVATGPELG
ncbi:MAG TPA: sulfurtransferase [Streptosporangiaceae bacterium]|nr:sulfurtransferase [Streptosporangiaceae bacterium]